VRGYNLLTSPEADSGALIFSSVKALKGLEDDTAAEIWIRGGSGPRSPLSAIWPTMALPSLPRLSPNRMAII